MVAALAERIAERIVPRGRHQLWTGSVSTSGTPEVWHDHRPISVRRWCWEQVHELEPDDKVIRTCRERSCVAPHHARLLDRVRPVLAAALRQRCGLTHRAIGEVLGVHYSVVHGWARVVTTPPPGENSTTTWRSAALCAGLPTVAWFDPRYEPAALALCSACPVQDQCLAYAVDNECSGCWGGKVRGVDPRRPR